MKKILQIDVRDDGLAVVECNIRNDLEMMRLTAAIVTLCYNDPAFKTAMVSAYRLMLEKESESKEAAKKYATEWHENPDGSAWKPYFEESAIKAFLAGANWQADHAPLPEDTALFNKGVEEGRRLAEEEQADLFTIVALDAAQRAKIKIMEDFPKWRKIKAGERLPCPAYVWTIAYDNYPDCFEGRLMPNIQGVKVGRDTWYLPVDVIHNLPKED